MSLCKLAYRSKIDVRGESFSPSPTGRGAGVRVGAWIDVDASPDPHPPGRSPSAAKAMDGRERPASPPSPGGRRKIVRPPRRVDASSTSSTAAVARPACIATKIARQHTAFITASTAASIATASDSRPADTAATPRSRLPSGLANPCRRRLQPGSPRPAAPSPARRRRQAERTSAAASSVRMSPNRFR